ncbi:MAG: tetratricopeptide repeat protein, partial [Chromatiaceae bacterium]
MAAAEQVLGEEHPWTLTSINNLASLYQAQGHYGDAEPLYRRVLAASGPILGNDHPRTLASVNNLAVLYQAQNYFGEAEPLFRRALAASERVFGETHPDTVAVQLNLGVLLIQEQRIDDAASTLRTLDERLRWLVSQELASTEQESVRLQRLAAESRLQNTVITLAVAHPNHADSQGLAADVLLRWKRLAADEEATIARLTRTSKDPR